MKKLLSIALAVALTAFAAMAKGNANVTTKVFKADVTCQNCADKIMNNVPSLGKGVKDVKVDVDKKTVTVTYDAAKNNSANIIKGLASLSVAASEVADGTATTAPAQQQQCAKIKANCCGRASEAKVESCCQAKDAKTVQVSQRTECHEAEAECKIANQQPAASCHK